MLWSYLIHLGTNMWDDITEPPAGTIEYTGTSIYRDSLFCDMDVWSYVTSALPAEGVNTLIIDVGDAVKFDTHPELAIKGSLDKRVMSDELDRLRSLGLTVVPKLNFSACHDTYLKRYAHMLSTDEYYKVCADLIAETCELFGNPAYFHLGLDEEDAPNQRNKLFAVIRSGALWWHDAYYLFDLCEKRGARPWVWSDYYWHNPESFKANMPKSVLQSNWYYGGIYKNADGRLDRTETQAYADLAQLGYDQVPTCSTWGFNGNIEQTVHLVHDDKMPNVKGFMVAPWLFTVEENRYGLINDAHRLGCIKRKLYPDEK